MTFLIWTGVVASLVCLVCCALYVFVGLIEALVDLFEDKK